MRVWNPEGGKELYSIRAFHPVTSRSLHSGGVHCVAFSPNGKTLAAGAYGGEFGEGTVRLYDVQTGDPVGELEGYERERDVPLRGFSPDGKILAAGSMDASMRLWDARTGKLLHDFGGNCFESVCFSPDGKTLASGEAWDRVRLWDVATGKEKRVPVGHEGSVQSVAYSPDGRTVATRGGDGMVRFWNARTGQPLRSWQCGRQFRKPVVEIPLRRPRGGRDRRGGKRRRMGRDDRP